MERHRHGLHHLLLVTCYLLIYQAIFGRFVYFRYLCPKVIEYMKKLLSIIALALDVLIRLAGIETNLKTNAFMRLVVLSPNLFTSKSLDNGLVEVTSMTS